MNKKSFFSAFVCYAIWGLNPIFWNLFTGPEPFFLLSARVVTSFLLTGLYLVIRGRGKEIVALVRDWKRMRFIICAALFLALDWGVYIWAVTAGFVIDTSLGYYMNPLVVFLFGVILFREKANGWEFAAVGIATCGVLIHTFIAGVFPILAVVFAFLFPVYAVFKKLSDSDPIVSITVETMLLAPFALAYIIITGGGEGGFPSLVGWDWPLLLCCGLVSSVPMLLYNSIVNDLPMKLVGIMEYLGTTIGMLCGLILGERMTGPKWILLSFIVAGIVVFTIGSVRKQRTLQSQ